MMFWIILYFSISLSLLLIMARAGLMITKRQEEYGKSLGGVDKLAHPQAD